MKTITITIEVPQGAKLKVSSRTPKVRKTKRKYKPEKADDGSPVMYTSRSGKEYVIYSSNRGRKFVFRKKNGVKYRQYV